MHNRSSYTHWINPILINSIMQVAKIFAQCDIGDFIENLIIAVEKGVGRYRGSRGVPTLCHTITARSLIRLHVTTKSRCDTKRATLHCKCTIIRSMHKYTRDSGIKFQVSAVVLSHSHAKRSRSAFCLISGA